MEGETEGREDLRRQMLRLQRVLQETYSQLDRLQEELGDRYRPLEPAGLQQQQQQVEAESSSSSSGGSCRTAAIMAQHALTGCLHLSRQVSRMRLSLLKKDIELEILATAQRLADSLEVDSSGSESSPLASPEHTRTDKGMPTECLNQLAHSSRSSRASSSAPPPVETGQMNEGLSPEQSSWQKASTSRITETESSSTAACLNMATTSSGIQMEVNNNKVSYLPPSKEEMLIHAIENSEADADRMDTSPSLTPPSEMINPSTAAAGKLETQTVIPTHGVHLEGGKTSVDEMLRGTIEPMEGGDWSEGRALDRQETIVSETAEDFSALSLTGAGGMREPSRVADDVSVETLSQVAAEKGRKSEADISSEREEAGYNYRSMNTSTKTETHSVSVRTEAVADEEATEQRRSLQGRKTDRSSQKKDSGEVFASHNTHRKPETTPQGNGRRGSETDSPAAHTRFKFWNVSLMAWKAQRKCVPAQGVDVKASTSAANRAGETSYCNDSKSANSQTESYKCSRGVSPLPIDKSSGNSHVPVSGAQSLSPEKKSSAYQNKTNSSQSTCKGQKGGKDSVSAEIQRNKTMEVPNVTPTGTIKEGDSIPCSVEVEISGEVLVDRNSRSKRETSANSYHSDTEIDSPAAHTRFKFLNVSLMALRAERKSVPAESVDVKASTSSANRAGEISSSDDSKSANSQNAGATETSGVGIVNRNSHSKPGSNHPDSEMDSPAAHTRFKFWNVSLLARRAERKSVPAQGAEVTASASSGKRAREISASSDSKSTNTVTQSYVSSRGASLLPPGNSHMPDLEASRLLSEKKSSFQNKSDSDLSTCKSHKEGSISASDQIERNKTTEMLNKSPTENVKEVDSVPCTVQAEATKTSGGVLVSYESYSEPENASPGNNHPGSEGDSPAAHTRFKFLNMSLLSQKAERKSSPALCIEETGFTSSVKHTREISYSGDSKLAKPQTESFECMKGVTSRPIQKVSGNTHMPDLKAHRLSSDKKSSVFQNKTNTYRSTYKGQKGSAIFPDSQIERKKTTELANITPTGKVKEVGSIPCTVQAGLTETSGEVLAGRSSQSQPEKSSSANTYHSDSEMDSPAAHTRFKFFNASVLARRAENKSVPAQSVEVTASTSGKRARETSSSDDDKLTNAQSESCVSTRGPRSSSKHKLSGKNLKPDLAFSTHSRKKSRSLFGSLSKGNGRNIGYVTSPVSSSDVRGTKRDSVSAGTRSKTSNYSGSRRRKGNRPKPCVSCSSPHIYSRLLGKRDFPVSLSTRSRRCSL